MAAIGDGRVDAIFGAAGIIVGSWIFAEVYPYLEDYLYEIGYMGKVTIPKLLGVSPWVIIVPFVVAVLIMFYLFEKFDI